MKFAFGQVAASFSVCFFLALAGLVVPGKAAREPITGRHPIEAPAIIGFWHEHMTGANTLRSVVRPKGTALSQGRSKPEYHMGVEAGGLAQSRLDSGAGRAVGQR